MSQELGKIERPTAESFVGTRKLFLVPLVFSPNPPPADFVGILERYWAGARNQVRRLGDRTGPIRHVYHEAVTQAGEPGRELIQRMSPRSYALLADYLKDDDAALEALEDAETFYESIDWQRCLVSGPMSQKVLDLALTGYREATKRRFEHMAQLIDQTLQPGESGLLLLPEEHRLQFPKDIQVFYVAPPALDEIHRWLRDQADRERRAAAPAAEEPSEAAGENAAESSGENAAESSAGSTVEAPAEPTE
jgi:hypothetical protein